MAQCHVSEFTWLNKVKVWPTTFARWATAMEALPACVLEQVLFLVPARDVVHVAMTSSSMREVALSETFWAAYVRNRWGTQTEVENWISEHPQGIFQHQKSQLKHPGTYRSFISDFTQIETIPCSACESASCLCMQ